MKGLRIESFEGLRVWIFEGFRVLQRRSIIVRGFAARGALVNSVSPFGSIPINLISPFSYDPIYSVSPFLLALSQSIWSHHRGSARWSTTRERDRERERQRERERNKIEISRRGSDEVQVRAPFHTVEYDLSSKFNVPHAINCRAAIPGENHLYSCFV